MIIKIDDYNSELLDPYTRMSEVAVKNIYAPELGAFIAESPNVIGRALSAGYEPVSVLSDEKELNCECVRLILEKYDVPVYTASYEVLARMTGFSLTRGILCQMRRLKLPSVDDIIGLRNPDEVDFKGREAEEQHNKSEKKNLVWLDEVMNPTNVGALFRSAAALNMDGILLSKGCADPLYRRCARVSMGTVFQIPWTYAMNKEATISKLKAEGYKFIAMALKENAVSINDPSLHNIEKKVIVMGSEGYGLSDEMIELCDVNVIIPMGNGVDSLNVAAAGAVAFYALGNI